MKATSRSLPQTWLAAARDKDWFDPARFVTAARRIAKKTSTRLAKHLLICPKGHPRVSLEVSMFFGFFDEAVGRTRSGRCYYCLESYKEAARKRMARKKIK